MYIYLISETTVIKLCWIKNISATNISKDIYQMGSLNYGYSSEMKQVFWCILIKTYLKTNAMTDHNKMTFLL